MAAQQKVTDDLTLIATSRARSAWDVLALFGKPLMAGSAFTDVAAFYRPVTSASFALDYARAADDRETERAARFGTGAVDGKIQAHVVTVAK